MFLVQSSIACPEQYEIYDDNNNYLGYIRLRHGLLSLYNFNQELIFSSWFDEPLKGSFDDEYERYFYLFYILNIVFPNGIS